MEETGVGETTLNIDVPSNDKLTYSKVDIVRVAQVNNEFAFSFFQFDYVALVDEIRTTKKLGRTKAVLPVTKVVMNKSTFEKLLVDLNKLKKDFDEISQTSTKGN